MHLILVPTYNEYQNITRLLDALCAIPSVHVLVIDDASPDGTAEVVRAHAHFSHKVFLLFRDGKEGLGAAYRAGFAWGLARDYETLTQMDADFSHHPEDVPKLFERISLGADVAIGSRKIVGGEIVGWNAWRHFCSSGAMQASRFFLGLRTQDVTAGFRTWRKDFLARLPVLDLRSNGYAFQEEMILHAELLGGEIHEVPVVFRDRVHGVSKLGFTDIGEFFLTLARLTALRRRRFLLYVFIGGMGALVDLASFLLLYSFFDVALLPANIIATGIAVVHNFLWHHFITFKEHVQGIFIAFLRFVSVSLVGMVLNSGIVLFAVSFGFLPVFGKICAIFCVTFWNYFMNSRVTFRL